ncbi:hypothetical protein WOLCODRAFT_79122 [Wolfiporia cocos MD-104 SS10]|uniref:Uncharacterized protein n=1 Tax=Wolfiporia cocos (strain MD-104) TaxID=742152 RepID=A0A2H3IYQ1_WOLCO|nr:hypothetical protein WOLCODRAFT_79122 [Wolfiporia cocos MD-104 SS10]
MPYVSIVSTNLATVCAEGFLYGIFFVLSLSSIYLLVHRQNHTSKRSGAHKAGQRSIYASPMLIGAVAMTVTITGHFICTATRLFEAFVYFDDGKQAMRYYMEIGAPVYVAKTALFMATLILGDALVTYRVWIVWNYSIMVVAFPICMIIGLIICGVGVTYQFAKFVPGDVIFETVSARWMNSDAAFTLCTNLYGSVMISLRVWRAHQALKHCGGGSLMGAVAIFVESAALYTMWTLLWLIAYHAKTNVQTTFADSWSAIAGIAFMLINVRVGLGWALTASQLNSILTIGTAVEESNHTSSYPMRPLTVNITRVVEDDYGEATKQKDLSVHTSQDSVDKHIMGGS